MTTCLTILRPRAARSSRPRRAVRPAPSSRPSSSWAPVTVEWDAVRGLHVARCGRCAESFTTVSAAQAYDWADAHECDRELAALLADPTGNLSDGPAGEAAGEAAGGVVGGVVA